MPQPIDRTNPGGPPVVSGRQLEPSESEMPLAVYRLSPRETQVAILSAEGLPAEEMARSLGIRVGTVRNIRRALRRKLDIPPSATLNESLSGLFGSEPSRGTRGWVVPHDACREPSAAGGARANASERRVHLSVRQAISSVGQLAKRLDARAAAVAGVAEHSPKARDQLVWESEQLLAMADALYEVQAQAIARVRAHLALMTG
jgi:DNA-binding CsgD family transcriptional regulator